MVQPPIAAESVSEPIVSHTLCEPQTQHFAPIHRWYDMDAQLSDMVRTIEVLSPQSQLLFGHLLKNTISRLIKLRGRAFTRELNGQTFLGIIKSKRSRRWYDQSPTLHTAFNMLFSLSDPDKTLIARELAIPAELIHDYEAYAKAHNDKVHVNVTFSILETYLTKGREEALSVYAIFHS